MSTELKERVREFKRVNNTASLKEKVEFNARRARAASAIEDHESVKKGLLGIVLGGVISGVGHIAAAATGIEAFGKLGNVAGGVVAGASIYENGKNITEGALEIKDEQELQVIEGLIEEAKTEEELELIEAEYQY